MGEGDDLLAAIAANCDDDAPRLIYADWLEENGQPERAELIRVQCESARLPTGSPRQQELVARANQLLKANVRQWTADFKPICTGERFHRGFVDSVFVNVLPLLIQTPRPPREWSIVRDASVVGANAVPDDLFDKVPLAPVMRWNCFMINGRQLPLLARRLAGVDRLDLRWNDLADESIPMLVDDFKSVSILWLAGNLFSRAGQGELQRALKDRCSFATERSPTFRYQVVPSDRVITGRDDQQRMIMITRAPNASSHAVTYIFDDEGNWVGKELGPAGFSNVHRVPLTDDPAVRNLCASMGLAPGPIAIRRFRDELRSVRLVDITRRHQELCDDPPSPHDPADRTRMDEYRHLRYSHIPMSRFELVLGDD